MQPNLAASGLAALLLAAVPARAEPSPGWVDPPARAGAAKPGPAAAPVAGSVAEPMASSAGRSAETGAAGSARPDPADGRPRGGLAQHRPDPRHRAERPERHRAHRPTAVASEIDTTAPDPRFGDQAGRAQRLAGEYLDSVSAPNGAMLAQAPRFYGSRVQFHGRSMSLGALIAEKRRFVRRWPERRYAPRDGTMRTACEAAGPTCVVRTVLGFSAESPARGARSQGVSELTLTVSFAGERPVIVAESSRVLRRGSAALSSAGRERGGGA